MNHRAVVIPIALSVLALVGCESAAPTASSPDRTPPTQRLDSAQTLRAEGDYEAALAELEQAIAENPALTDAHMSMGEIYSELGDNQQAERSYGRAARLEPSNFDAQFNHGLALQLLNRLSEAVRAYLRALTLEPNDAQANLNLATAYLQLGEPQQALPYAQRAVRFDDANGAAHVNLGAILSASGRDAEAVRAYEAAAERMDPTVPLLLNLAEALGKTGRYEEMVNTLEAANRIEVSALTYERIGSARFRMGDYESALESFRTSVVVDPQHYPGHNGVAVCLLNRFLQSDRADREALQGARDAMRASLRLNRDQPRVVQLLSRYQ